MGLATNLHPHRPTYFPPNDLSEPPPNPGRFSPLSASGRGVKWLVGPGLMLLRLWVGGSVCPLGKKPVLVWGCGGTFTQSQLSRLSCSGP